MSRAAGDVHIAQSALSQHVASLERELKISLLVRSARGVTPTEAGKQLYRHAQLLLQQAEHARASVLSCSSEPSGPVSFGMPLSLAVELAFPVFEAVWLQYPLVRLQMQEGVSGNILDWIKNGRLTLGVAFDNGNLDGLDSVPVVEERLFLAVSPRSPLARRKIITLAEVEQLELVMPMPGQGVRPRLEQAMVREGLVLSRVVGEANSLSLLKQAAASGVAPTVLGWLSIAKEVERGILATVEIVRPTVTRSASLCMLPSAAYSQSALRVRDAAAKTIRLAIARSKWRGVRALHCTDERASNPVAAAGIGRIVEHSTA